MFTVEQKLKASGLKPKPLEPHNPHSINTYLQSSQPQTLSAQQLRLDSTENAESVPTCGCAHLSKGLRRTRTRRDLGFRIVTGLGVWGLSLKQGFGSLRLKVMGSMRLGIMGCRGLGFGDYGFSASEFRGYGV